METVVAVTPETLEATVRELATEQPDFIYVTTDPNGKCSYFPDSNNPLGCIIGAALRRLGREVDDDFEGRGAAEVLEKGEGWGDDDLSWFENVQTQQDDGFKWAQAVASADETRRLEAVDGSDTEPR